jgi:hypothetical protein
MKRTVASKALVAVFVTVFALGIPPKAWPDDHRGCSDGSLQGSFGFTSTGTLALPPPLAGPFTEIGRQTFDGRGNTDATATLSANGNIVSGVTLQGTYLVNPDCTGSMTLFVSPIGVTSHVDFVIDDDGAELRAIITDAGIVENRVYKKQFSRGRKEQ